MKSLTIKSQSNKTSKPRQNKRHNTLSCMDALVFVFQLSFCSTNSPHTYSIRILAKAKIKSSKPSLPPLHRIWILVVAIVQH